MLLYATLAHEYVCVWVLMNKMLFVVQLLTDSVEMLKYPAIIQFVSYSEYEVWSFE